MAAIDTPGGFCVGGGFFIACGILSNGTHGGVGAEIRSLRHAIRHPRFPNLLTVIEWYFEFTSKWQIGSGNQDATHPTIMQLS